MMMVTSWYVEYVILIFKLNVYRTSATNCARIYNEGLVDDEVKALLPADWQFSLQLNVDDVWNGFFLHALIIDHLETGSAGLELIHNIESQPKRLQPALKERNARMAGPGQEAWNHACDRCCYVFQDISNGQSCEFTVIVACQFL